MLQPVLFPSVLFGRVALRRGGCPWGEGGWSGSSPQQLRSPAEPQLPEADAVTAALEDRPSAQSRCAQPRLATWDGAEQHPNKSPAAAGREVAGGEAQT